MGGKWASKIDVDVSVTIFFQVLDHVQGINGVASKNLRRERDALIVLGFHIVDVTIQEIAVLNAHEGRIIGIDAPEDAGMCAAPNVGCETLQGC